MSDKYYTYKGQVTNIVDGDTLDILVDLGFNVSTHLRFRLDRIDAHEIRGDTEENEKKGRREASYLSSLVLGETVYVTSKKSGKYGRWIAEVYLDADLTKNVNNLMQSCIGSMNVYTTKLEDAKLDEVTLEKANELDRKINLVKSTLDHLKEDTCKIIIDGLYGSAKELPEEIKYKVQGIIMEHYRKELSELQKEFKEL